MRKEPECLKCDYFKATVLTEGQCRRYSPKQSPEYAMGKFPTVNNDWWCGEWWNQEWYDQEIHGKERLVTR